MGNRTRCGVEILTRIYGRPGRLWLLGSRLKRYRREMDKRIWLKRSELDAIFTPRAVDER